MIDSVQEAITRMAEAVNEPVGETILMSKADALAIGTHIYTQERQLAEAEKNGRRFSQDMATCALQLTVRAERAENQLSLAAALLREWRDWHLENHGWMGDLLDRTEAMIKEPTHAPE